MDKHPHPILLIEDDKLDADLVKLTLLQANINNELLWIDKAPKALEYLQVSDSNAPCLLILDNKMPKMTGIELLQTIRKENIHNELPIIMLTSFKEDEAMFQAYNLGISAYINKPFALADFNNAIKEIPSLNFYLL
ncbi:response regulator [Fangia hongkongensis]|uniref:response regulator n=1 Tax=Fangia hongkongensis TaxID=270495 RepID=UPI00036637C0|nr:response regulator [Fangia hongkongensis]MBK2125869.1 response regulator [Fangia hongkongensis]